LAAIAVFCLVTDKPHSGFPRPHLGVFAYAGKRLRSCGPAARHKDAALLPVLTFATLNLQAHWSLRVSRRFDLIA